MEVKYSPQQEDEFPRCLDVLLSGIGVPVDMKHRHVFPTPTWLDKEKFIQGQQFALKSFWNICFAEMCSLIMIFNFNTALDPLIFTTKSSTSSSVYLRYASTLQKIRTWYTDDIWDSTTSGGQNIMRVRAMHCKVRDQLNNYADKSELKRRINIKNPCCPMLNFIREDANNSIISKPNHESPYSFSNINPSYFNQFDMTCTQFAFNAMVILHPEKFGIRATNTQLEAFLHMWAGIGYLLGIEDRYNFCLGDLNTCKSRAEVFITTWVKPNFRNVQSNWEHMSRSLINGAKIYTPVPYLIHFEAILCYLFSILEIPLPLFRSVIPWYYKFCSTLYSLIFTILVCFVPGLNNLMNTLFLQGIQRALNTNSREKRKRQYGTMVIKNQKLKM